MPIGKPVNDLETPFLTEACPCDWCPHRRLCARDQLACRQLQAYVADENWQNKAREPSARLFDCIYHDPREVTCV